MSAPIHIAGNAGTPTRDSRGGNIRSSRPRRNSRLMSVRMPIGASNAGRLSNSPAKLADRLILKCTMKTTPSRKKWSGCAENAI